MINQVVEEKILKLDKSKWKLTKLGTLAKDISVRVDKPGESEYERFVGLDNFISGDIKIKHWASTKNLTSSAKAFKAGDILFARRNAYLRRASLVDFDGCCSGDAFVIRENLDKVVPGFLAFLMNTNSLWDYANSNAAGTMSKRVKWRDLAEYEFLLPTKAEQASLAELLWAMDEVIEKEKRVLGKLHTNLISIEYLYFDVQSNVALKKVIQKTISGGTPSTKDNSFYINGTIPWITTKTLNEDRTFYGEKLITVAAVQNSATKILPKGNILAGTRVGVGKFSINEVDISFSQDINGLYVENDLANVEYLLYQLNSNCFQKKIEPLLRGTTIKGILKEDLLNLKIRLPEMDIQIENALVINKVKKSIFQSKTKISASQSLQKSLINQIF